VNEDRSSCAAVELREVSKRFGERTILDSIDLLVARGEILVLVGKSGSGKSTLLKMVSGIETPDSGRVFLAGRDCTAEPPYKRSVHTVFQNYALFPHLDVLGNVMFPLRIAGANKTEASRRAAEALDWVQLGRHASRRVDSLSGGERQRVALARALVDSPECVLLDEPLSALDPHLRAETLGLLEEIQQRLHCTFLFITHDREEALRIADRIGVLNQGRLEQVGTPQEVYDCPRTPFVASFLGRINWLPRRTEPRSVPPNGKLGVRPEDLRIDAGGQVRATITACQFLGDCVHVRLALADGTEVVVDQRAPLDGLRPGQEVGLAWEDAAAHIFEPEEPSA
jgi:ABC-type Fe3+/spermidine/putrescine transport system ATPase subunit